MQEILTFQPTLQASWKQDSVHNMDHLHIKPYGSCSDMEIHALKLQVHSSHADVNARGIIVATMPS